ncbi:uncharacterized protein SCHCODRAFT_02609265 [Schizophyllum commune H4-8]|uniref:uncharacterized protein n=1 Tax=Schizophyllum commune (strain H4-8 / FGSC 9210) TaxID=578458 RepID=UPI00216023A5|nr:uncharacterized protein SCHCODRAFT_02609265 [Schizophyllum commune H4-8]KAI5897400.1 hypothetical protein SCHCODRAFT_02609265 [Schizophyllum commune H4-8]
MLRVKQRAAALIDAHTDDGALPVRAPSTTSRNDDGTHSFPPSPCSPTPCYDATPGSSSDTVAVAPRMRPTRNSQAWETGGSVLCTTARMARLWGEESGLSLAMPNEPGHRYHSQFR